MIKDVYWCMVMHDDARWWMMHDDEWCMMVMVNSSITANDDGW